MNLSLSIIYELLKNDFIILILIYYFIKMNNKITQVLRVLQTGDIQEYFNEVDKIIQLNNDIHYNKMLIQECYNKQTPITYN